MALKQNTFVAGLCEVFGQGPMVSSHPGHSVHGQGRTFALLRRHGDLVAERTAFHLLGGVAQAVGALIQKGVVDLLGVPPAG